MSYLGQQLGQGQAERFVFTASGGETSVTTSDDGRAVAYTVGQVDVYLNGAKLINGSDFTATTGTSITGLSALTASDVVEVFALSIFQASDTVSAASGGTFNGNVTMAANLSFGDNNKAIFGAGSDLQIYHDGFHSNIKETGAGSLIIDAANTIFRNADATKSYAVMTDGGSIDLYYNNALKLATTATGIDVTGTVTADGLAVSTSSAVTAQLGRDGSDGDVLQIYNGAIGSTKALALGVDGTSGTIESQFGNIDIKPGSALAAKFASGGDISFYEDTGTTPKFFWDASAERLGLGTTSPSANLGVNATAPDFTFLQSDVVKFRSGVSGTTNGGVTGSASGDYFARTSGGKMLFSTNDGVTAHAVIDSSGLVGIGTTSPQSVASGYGALTIGGTSGGGINFNSTGSAFGQIYGNNTNVVMSAFSNRFIAFNTNGSERARIDSSGNLLVGTTSTGLDLSTNASGLMYTPSNFLCIATTVGGNSNIILNKTNSSAGTCVDIRYNGNIVGTIQNTASSTSYNTSSDYRLKDVDGPITNSGAYIDALKPVQGSWKADGSRFIGLIAHEVQEVSETPIATGEKDGKEMQGMDYSAPELIANLIAEIQSLRARVAQLEGA